MASDANRYQTIVERHGMSGTHRQVIEWTPRGADVLEVGCATGYVGRALREEKGCRVTGIEFDSAAAAEARGNGLTVIEGSLEDQEFRNSVAERFDVVVAADVLEHLRDPAPVLNHFKRWLRKDGVAIIAVPNVAAWKMRAQLFFRGDFEYQDAGLLDRTHLHFFTWDTLHQLVRAQGWDILDTMVEGWQLPVGRKPLVLIPRDLRRAASTLSTLKGPIGTTVYRALDGLAGGLVKGGDAVQHAVFRRWPNLCAGHIALKLRARE